MNQIIIFSLLMLNNFVCGQDFGTFVAQHAKNIENYIMVGYGEGWKSCDLISTSKSYQLLNSPNFVMDLDKIESIDIGSLLSSSTCVLIISLASDKETISRLVEFGQSAAQHKRIGMILKLDSSTYLRSINSTKIPYLLGAQMVGGRSQFLCPTTGSHRPIVESGMCPQTYTGYKGRYIRVGFHDGFRPYGFVNEGGNPDGIEARFMELVQEQMGFKANFTFFKSDKTGFQLVQ